MTLKKASRASLALDKENYLASVAEKADKCAIKGDHRSSYILVRQLGGNKPRQPLALEHEEGHIVSAPAAVRDRFIRHVAGVFDAKVCKFEDVEFKQGNQNVGGFVFVNQKVQRQISKLAKTKGLGPDGVPAELLQLAIGPSTAFFTQLLNCSATCMYVPAGWRGGGDLLVSLRTKAPPPSPIIIEGFFLVITPVQI